jgi:2,3,4,5-tetrahydropyridine-2,6-dicarboxylate N-succinyltransferase
MTDLEKLQSVIESAFERRAELNPRNLTSDLGSAIDECIELLDSGRARVAEPTEGRWVVNEWLKKAVLLYFRSHDNVVMDAGYTRFYDKVPLKYSQTARGHTSHPMLY